MAFNSVRMYGILWTVAELKRVYSVPRSVPVPNTLSGQ